MFFYCQIGISKDLLFQNLRGGGTVVWSDLLLIFVFRKWTHANQSFRFPKIAGTFKNEYFLENFKIPSFCINEHLLKRKFEITKKNYFRPQKWAKWFLTRTREKRGFLNFLAVKKKGNTFCFGASLKKCLF